MFTHTSSARGGAGSLLSHMGYAGICGPKGHDLLAVLVRNRQSILAILVSNRLWFLHSSIRMYTLFKQGSYKVRNRSDLEKHFIKKLNAKRFFKTILKNQKSRRRFGVTLRVRMIKVETRIYNNVKQ